jgi:hypothetical protein
VAARDIFHDAVIKALEKEGWSITHDPMSIQVGGVEMHNEVNYIVYDVQEEAIVRWQK